MLDSCPHCRTQRIGFWPRVRSDFAKPVVCPACGGTSVQVPRGVWRPLLWLAGLGFFPFLIIGPRLISGATWVRALIAVVPLVLLIVAGAKASGSLVVISAADRKGAARLSRWFTVGFVTYVAGSLSLLGGSMGPNYAFEGTLRT
jgi:hypothetical protein